MRMVDGRQRHLPHHPPDPQPHTGAQHRQPRNPQADHHLGTPQQPRRQRSIRLDDSCLRAHLSAAVAADGWDGVEGQGSRGVGGGVRGACWGVLLGVGGGRGGVGGWGPGRRGERGSWSDCLTRLTRARRGAVGWELGGCSEVGRVGGVGVGERAPARGGGGGLRWGCGSASRGCR